MFVLQAKFSQAGVGFAKSPRQMVLEAVYLVVLSLGLISVPVDLSFRWNISRSKQRLVYFKLS